MFFFLQNEGVKWSQKVESFSTLSPASLLGNILSIAVPSMVFVPGRRR